MIVPSVKNFKIGLKYNENPDADPFNPANRVQMFVRNRHGKVVPVVKWLGVDLVETGKAVWAKEEEYYQQEAIVKPAAKPAKKVKEPKQEDRLDRLEKNLDKLTDAVLQLVEQKPKKGKK